LKYIDNPEQYAHQKPSIGCWVILLLGPRKTLALINNHGRVFPLYLAATTAHFDTVLITGLA